MGARRVRGGRSGHSGALTAPPGGRARPSGLTARAVRAGRAGGDAGAAAAGRALRSALGAAQRPARPSQVLTPCVRELCGRCWRR